MRKYYHVGAEKSDPFGHLPLMMGSILSSGVQSVRMIKAKHQSALIWANTWSKKQKTAAGMAKVMN